jgi:hypothetical protein
MAEATGARMPGSAICRHGRSSQDELPRCLSIVDRPPHVVQIAGSHLPLVKQARDGSLQDDPWIEGSSGTRILVDVEQDLAGSTARLYRLQRHDCTGAKPGFSRR